MDVLSDREQQFERAYARDEELRFKARARGRKRLAAWMAEFCGVAEAERSSFAATLSERLIALADEDAVVAEALAGAPDGREPPSASRLRRRLAEFEAQALEEIQAGR